MRESSLRKILAVLRARWLLVLVLAVPVLLLGGWYAGTRPPSYTAEVVLTFTPEPTASPDASFVRLLPRYLTVATTRESLEAAAAAAGVPASSLDDAVTVVRPTGSVEVIISVTTSSPRSSTSAVSSLSDSVLAAAEADPLVGARVIGPAGEPEDGSRLRQLAAVAAGVGLSPLPGVAVAFVLEGARPRIRAREDVEALGVETPRVLRARRLRTEGTPQLGALALDVSATVGSRPGQSVVLSSPRRSDDAAVARLAGSLSSATGLPVADGARPASRGAGPALLVAPGLLTEEAAQSAVLRSGSCVLVLPSGTVADEAEDCLRLLEQLQVRLSAVVLLH